MSEIEHSMWATQKALQNLRAQIVELEGMLERGELGRALRVGAAVETQAAQVRTALSRVDHAERHASRDREHERHWVRIADRFDRTLDVFGPLSLDEAYTLRERHTSSQRRVQILESGDGTSARIRAWWSEVAARRQSAGPSGRFGLA